MVEHRPLSNWHPGPWSVPQDLAGTAVVTPKGPVVAGSWQTFEIVYRAGRFGIDDSGSIKVCFRFATDQTRLQLQDPTAPGFVSVAASNGATLDARFDYKQNVRPWDRTLHLKVVRGFMREGDTITVIIGDRRQGSPGLRVQTFSEPYFEFRVLADPIACYQFVPVANQPCIAIVGGPRLSWTAVIPSHGVVGAPFAFRMRSEDVWGNPSNDGAADLRLSANLLLGNLPARLQAVDGAYCVEVDGLVAKEAGTLILEVHDLAGTLVARTNPMTVRSTKPAVATYWADFHAQSGETIGTNAAEDYFSFARDKAFLDIVGHQGNDFQITAEFWQALQELYDRFDESGRFVTMPGYEWSGNTPLGGDRNVFFRTTGRPIRRSSHALVADHSDIEMDCHTANDLFAALKRDKEDAITFAHVGGRYADIGVAHDASIETAVEVHSSWGTFEWIVNDAFDLGYRVGIVGNSDGHKGRPGAEAPGASMFGAYGGLTAMLLPVLSRDAVFEALRARRHYATTGSRLLLDVRARFGGEAMVFAADPALGNTTYERVETAVMGNIVHAPNSASATLAVTVAASSPIERIEVRNGRDIVHVIRPYKVRELGRRIRVVWSGAEYRGRFRLTPWDGTATLTDNAFEAPLAINFFNKDRTLDQLEPGKLTWKSVTTGNFSGFDTRLKDPRAGTFRLETTQGVVECAVASIGFEPTVFDFGGLDRKLTITRLPDENPYQSYDVECTVPLKVGVDNPLYVSVVTEDGHQAWTSPIYAIDRPKWL